MGLKMLKIAVSVILIVMLAILPAMLYPRLTSDEITDELYRRREKYYYGVITLWQLDCFEGGTGSRANWLKDIVGGFEKQNNGVYISVESLTPEMACKLIESGQKKPDVISFGSVASFDRNMLEDLQNDISVFPENIRSICFDCAVPWCMGAYFMLGDGDVSLWGQDGKTVQTKKSTKDVYSVEIGRQRGLNAAAALRSFCDTDFSQELALKTNTSQNVFEDYNYSYKAQRMLGTQRDLYRLASAQNRELARNGEILYINTYSDIFQYIGIMKCDNAKKLYTMRAFVQYMLGKNVQDEIGKIGMFPVISNAEPEYSNEYIKKAWNEIKMFAFRAETYLFDVERAESEYDNKVSELKKYKLTSKKD